MAGRRRQGGRAGRHARLHNGGRRQPPARRSSTGPSSCPPGRSPSSSPRRPTGPRAWPRAGCSTSSSRRPAARSCPRQVRQGDKWVAAPALLGPAGRQLREYRWPLDGHAGKRVRIAVVDADGRAGLPRRHDRLPPGHARRTQRPAVRRRHAQAPGEAQPAKPLRYDSKHFMAMSTAGTATPNTGCTTARRSTPCSSTHFRKRGFEAHVPAEKMMVAIFDTQDGFEAYVGQKMSVGGHGAVPPGDEPAARLRLRHQPRLRVERGPRATRRGAARPTWSASGTGRVGPALPRPPRRRERQHGDARGGAPALVQLRPAQPRGRRAGLAGGGAGLLLRIDRQGRLAGPRRGQPVAGRRPRPAARGGAPFIPLRDLVGDDDWIRKATRADQVLLGYSQSWALFRMLMEERPEQLKAYLEAIYDRRTPDHRLSDFGAAFGATWRSSRNATRRTCTPSFAGKRSDGGTVLRVVVRPRARRNGGQESSSCQVAASRIRSVRVCESIDIRQPFDGGEGRGVRLAKFLTPLAGVMVPIRLCLSPSFTPRFMIS